MLDGNHKAKAS